MSTSPKTFALGFALVVACALGSGATFLALRDRVPSPGQVGPRVTGILSDPDPVRRIAELSGLLQSLDSTAVPELVEAFQTARLDDGDPEFALLAMWWASFDPKAAFTWSTSKGRAQSGSVTAAVFRTWAHSDPISAIGTARALPYQLPKEIAVEAAIAGWDESGRPGLVESLMQLDDSDLQRLSEGLARRRVATLGPAGAFRWVESLQATPRFQQVLGERVASTAAESAEGAPLAAAWATPRVRSDDRVSNYPRRIATRWVAHDPEAAMAWLATLPAGADRDDGVTEAFRDWMIGNKDAASAWLQKSEIQRWNEPAWGLYARAVAEDRPEEALELAQRISDTELRDTTQVVVGRRWMRKDRAAAEAWLAKADVSDRVRRSSAMVKSNGPSETEPARAGELPPTR